MLKELEGFEKIIVTKDEALKAFATNLVSTGETVILNSGAPKLKSELLKRDFKVIELALPELKKGGGSIRCSSLAIS
jgi:N-dimethylarginine dimethylaminohydrolase